MYTLDTAAAIQRITDAGADRAVAQAIVEEIARSDQDLATKADVEIVRADVKSVRADIKSVRADLKSVRADVMSVHAEVKSVHAELAALRESAATKTELRAVDSKVESLHSEIKILRSDMEKAIATAVSRLLVIGFGGLFGGLGVLFAVLRYFPG